MLGRPLSHAPGRRNVPGVRAARARVPRAPSKMPRSRAVAVTVRAGALAVSLIAARAAAQTPSPAPAAPDAAPAVAPSDWRGTGELGVNLLFGAARQQLVAGAIAAARVDSGWSRRVELQGSYAEAREDGASRVLARAARLSAALDHRPYAAISGFGFASVETNRQQRIGDREAGGAGAKVTPWRGPAADEDASVSLALLVERTRPSDAGVPVQRRVRWSLRPRLRRQLSPTVRLSHVTFYQPAVDRPGRFTAETTTVLASALRAGLDLTVTLRDRYDSEARGRGARSNHDGQLLLGVAARF